MIETLEQQKNTENQIITCPACNYNKTGINFIVTGKDGKNVKWNYCRCGSIFHTETINKPNIFNEFYKKRWLDMKDIQERFIYELNQYVPFIEEMTYGRLFLDVGFTLPHGIDFLENRGWIVEGIDLITNDFITNDFEEYEFNGMYDFIHFGHVLESFEDPLGALEKAYSILHPSGVLLITTPAPELIHAEGGISQFGHWVWNEKKNFLSENILKKEAYKIGFDWVMSRINYSKRFHTWNDRHLILQKKEYG